jgi:uncharacterized phage protein (TIGR02218 family)
MKTLSAQLKAHYAQTLTTLAVCARVEQDDGTEYFFTSHDRTITYDGDDYEPADPMKATAVETKADFSVDNAEIMAFIGGAADQITETGVAARELDGAVVDLFEINYEDTSMGVNWLAKGWRIGNIQLRDGHTIFEIRGKAQLLSQTINELVSPQCRADLGDERCGIDLNDTAGTFRLESAVDSVDATEPRRKFTDTYSIGEGTSSFPTPFTGGKVVWTGTGTNAGYEMEVKAWDAATGEFELLEAMPFAIEAGDNYTAFWGCPKTADACIDPYANIVNFRGEQFVPGLDKIQQVGTPPRN